MTRLLPVLALALAACTPAARDALTRDAARTAIMPVMQARYPSVPLDRSLDCVAGAATPTELDALAADTLTGATASTVEIVGRIAARPAAAACLAP